MKKISFAVICAFLFLFVGANVFALTAANVIVVAKSGGDFTSIQDAINSISPSDLNPYTIKVMPGTYNEHVNLARSNTTLIGAGGSAVTTINNSTPNQYILNIGQYSYGISNVAVSGFTVTGNSSVFGGIAVYGGLNGYTTSNITIKDNVITGTGGAGIALWAGASSGNIVNVVLQGNTVTNCSYEGIGTNGSMSINQLIIAQNVVKNNGSLGIWAAAPGTQIVRNFVTGQIHDIYSWGSSVNVSFNVYDTAYTQGQPATGGSYNVTSTGAPISPPAP